MVSIPFKREGLSEQLVNKPLRIVTFVSIPFKREGLSERNHMEIIRTIMIQVSIPFKREGLSELSISKNSPKRLHCFNSLQTGRSFRTN